MFKKIKKPLLLTFISITGLFYFLKKGPEFAQILDLSLSNIMLASVVILFSYFFYGLKFKYLFHPFGISLAPREWFGLSMILTLGNFIFFKAGTITAAVYIHRRYHLAYTKFITALTAERIFLLYAYSSVGIILCFIMDIPFKHQISAIIFFVFLLSTLSYILFHFSFNPPKWKNRLGSIFEKILNAWITFKQYKSNSINLILIQTIVILSWATRFYVAFNFIDFPISFSQATALSLSIFLTGLINLVPGGLGVREVTVGIAMSMMGVSFDFGIYAVTLDRIISTLWFIMLGSFYLNYLHIKQFQKDSSIIKPEPSF